MNSNSNESFESIHLQMFEYIPPTPQVIASSGSLKRLFFKLMCIFVSLLCIAACVYLIYIIGYKRMKESDATVVNSDGKNGATKPLNETDWIYVVETTTEQTIATTTKKWIFVQGKAGK